MIENYDCTTFLSMDTGAHFETLFLSIGFEVFNLPDCLLMNKGIAS